MMMQNFKNTHNGNQQELALSNVPESNRLLTEYVQYSICRLYKQEFLREEIRSLGAFSQAPSPSRDVAKNKQPWKGSLHTIRIDPQYEAMTHCFPESSLLLLD